MLVVDSFPHTWRCVCGHVAEARLCDRGLNLECPQCGQENGPFELRNGPTENDATQKVIAKESQILSNQTGDSIVQRFIRLVDTEAQRDWSERTVTITLAVVQELKKRLSNQLRTATSQRSAENGNARFIAISNLALVQGLMKLMEVVDDAPASAKKLKVFGELCDTIQTFPDTVPCLDEELSRRLLTSSLRLRPTTLKAQWLISSTSSFTDDRLALKETIEWLANESAVPESVQNYVRAFLRRDSEKKLSKTDDEERNVKLLRYILMACIGGFVGYTINQYFSLMREQGTEPTLVELLLYIPGGFLAGGLVGMLFGGISNIRPIPITAQDRAESRRGAIMVFSLMLWMGTVVAAIMTVYVFWRILTGVGHPVIGVVCGLIGIFVVGFAMRQRIDRLKERERNQFHLS